MTLDELRQSIFADIVAAGGFALQSFLQPHLRTSGITILRHGRQVATVSVTDEVLCMHRLDPSKILGAHYEVVDNIIWDDLEKHPPEGMCIVPRRARARLEAPQKILPPGDACLPE